MENQNQQQNQMQPGQQMPPNTSMNHGGHEILDAHEAISGLIGMLEQYQMYNQHIQDQELKDIAQRQTAFATQTYNTIVESFQTGQDPSTPTQQYKMQQDNNVTYGLKPGQPKKPKQSVNELTDECFSSFMLGQTKGLASTLTMTSLEMTNPVLRRVFADSVPNFIEMSYETSLYQNKNGYYQVPQLKEQDMSQMLQSYTKAPQTGNMPH